MIPPQSGSHSDNLRLEALLCYAILDSEPVCEFEAIVNIASAYFGVPIAFISLADECRQWFNANVGLDTDEFSRDVAFCDFAIRTHSVMVVEDAAMDERFSSNPLVTGAPFIRFYAGAALVSPSEQAIGALCIIDTKPHFLNERDIFVLTRLAKQVVLQLELRKANSQKSEALQAVENERRLQREHEIKVQNSYHLLNSLTHMAPGVLFQYRLNPDGTSSFPFASAGIVDIFEVTPQDVLHDATPVFERRHPEDYATVARSIMRSAETLEVWECEYRVILPRQGVRWRHGKARPEKLEDGSILWHGFIVDSTESRVTREEIERLAFFDSLTDLPNRRLLIERASQALASARRGDKLGALFFLDMDNFKELNDSRGHLVGDTFLQKVAQRLSSFTRAEDTVARVGGDEFVVLVDDLGEEKDTKKAAMQIAEKLRIYISLPFHFDGDQSEHSGTASIGVTVFPRGSETVTDLLREADTALYRAKAMGRNCVAFFEPAMQTEIERHIALVKDLRQAVSHCALDIYAQSQVNLAGVVIGAELLLRWNHPTRGNIEPNEFISLAEESDLILDIGCWALMCACETLVKLDSWGRNISLSVNVSPKQFQQSNFVQTVLDSLAHTGANPASLILEVTEGILIKNMDETVIKMNELVAHGVRFSIDDFGTGYSSLAYLKKLPLHEIKIDRAFIQDIPHDLSGTAIVQSIIAMAGPLNLQLVAEGVETKEQTQYLTEHNCHVLQGFLFSKPVPIGDWLKNLESC